MAGHRASTVALCGKFAIAKHPGLFYSSRAMGRALFLFNHDAAHQAAHLAGIAGATARLAQGHEVVIAYAGPVLRTRLEALVGEGDARRMRWEDLRLPAFSRLLARPLDKLLPASRLMRLRHNEALFASADLIVSTERTCLRVRRRLRARMGDAAPLFGYVPHGSGDRNVAYHPELAQFDHMFVSGRKLVDEMVARGLTTPDRCHLTGYPKFDTIDRDARPRFFDNDRPTFLYNPHFDPKLSSWYDHGPALLEWFAARSTQYNLIFAPHVMLFRKTLHISPEYRVARRRPDIPEVARKAANILIDTDSPRLFDMSYTLSADAYIGDMSSQVYEFLLRRRPVFFIDTHSADLPHEAANRAFWGNGPVITSVAELGDLIPQYQSIGREYRPTQDRLFAYTIDDRPGERATDRAGQVISDILSSQTADKPVDTI